MTNTRQPQTDEYSIKDRDLIEPSPSGDSRAVRAVFGLDPVGGHVLDPDPEAGA